MMRGDRHRDDQERRPATHKDLHISVMPAAPLVCPCMESLSTERMITSSGFWPGCLPLLGTSVELRNALAIARPSRSDTDGPHLPVRHARPLRPGAGSGGRTVRCEAHDEQTLTQCVQAIQFAYFVKWGMTPAQALQMPTINAAVTPNFDLGKQVGTVEKGKFADIIAVSGDPLADITEMERVKFVIKGGMVFRDEMH